MFGDHIMLSHFYVLCTHKKNLSNGICWLHFFCQNMLFHKVLVSCNIKKKVCINLVVTKGRFKKTSFYPHLVDKGGCRPMWISNVT